MGWYGSEARFNEAALKDRFRCVPVGQAEGTESNYGLSDQCLWRRNLVSV
jgi:hypothetical protein